MEFNQKVDNDKPPPYFSSASSGDGYFTEQALRALHRELEKERIREEIIAEERRALELEVRRELLMERELALQRRAHSHGFPLLASSASVLRADPRLTLMLHPEGSNKLDESFSGFSSRADAGMHQAEGAKLEETLSLPPPSDVGSLEKLPLQRSTEPRMPDFKPLSDGCKTPVLFFAKPTHSSLAGLKRKVLEPPSAIIGAGQLPLVGSKKKQQEWSCALCQVSATSEKGLNDHVQGRKHKAKEAALLASKNTSKNTGGSTPSTKATDKPTKTTNTSKSSNKRKGKKHVGNKQQHVKQDGDAPVHKKQKLEASRKKFKFWCEMCQVGTHGRKVMTCHEKGKKHVFLLGKLKKENGSIPGTTTLSESAHEKPENVDTKAEETNEITENVEREVDGSVETDKKEEGDANKDESGKIDMVDSREEVDANKDESGKVDMVDSREEGDADKDESGKIDMVDSREEGDANKDELGKVDMVDNRSSFDEALELPKDQVSPS